MATDNGTLKALVIEDDDDIRRLLEVVLAQAGHDVTSAATGTDGIAQARDSEPSLITLDIGLPDMDGYAVARQLREFYAGHLVMLSARSEPYDAALGLEVGADAYITKPFRPRALRERLAEIMSQDARSSD
ncbi:response regulator receiver domain-containing protein [Antricoccus suffuscus]|uniref:Response regulator receiver domain-containing protein n=1 Tax=Antricoccus suffuscus TaxID=1629062 RepID=A0A2T1A749_9ACTN|nr:response regulator [Antricoccus suffuscus]PRZ44433.1 response regulator receiver domain-containing protein [Antricoccus suffuscus]